MLPVRARETGMRVPFGTLPGEMGRMLSETGGESTEGDSSKGYGCERARERGVGREWAPAYIPPEDDSAVREDWRLGRGIELAFD